MRTGRIYAAVLAISATIVMAPVAGAFAQTAPQALDFVTVNFTLKGTKHGKLTLRLTRGTKLYAKGVAANAKPGKNKVRMDAVHKMFPGKYTFRWTFVPSSGKTTSGKSIVTVTGPA